MEPRKQEEYLLVVDLATVHGRWRFHDLDDAATAFDLVSTRHPYARVTLWCASGILRRRKPRNLFDLARTPN